MSQALSTFLALFILANVAAYLWLLLSSSNKSNDNEEHVWDEDIHELNNPMPRWWKVMFLLSIVFGIGYFVLYPGLGNWQGTLGWSSKAAMDLELAEIRSRSQTQLNSIAALPLPDLSRNETAVAQGAAVFSRACAGCHGSAAKGFEGFPDLTDNDWLYGGDAETVYQSISEGRTGGMPPFAAMLTPAQIDTVAAYIQQWPENAVSAAEQQGQQLFLSRCAFCHGQNGEGNYAFGAPRLNDDIWLYGGDRLSVVQSISKGRTGEMPAHKTLLSDEQLRVVTAWVVAQTQARQ